MIKEREEFSMLNEAPFTASDRMIVRHLREDWGESNYWILLAAAFCNLAVREGHTYLDLAAPQSGLVSVPRTWPAPDRWAEMVEKSAVAQRDGQALSKPLVLSSDSCLYLEKYYNFEQQLAGHIRRRCAGVTVRELVADPVERAVTQPFFVITGGPGTGKTTLALRYLDKLLSAWEGDRPARFAAIAPTGKAAARLAESISNGVQGLNVSEARKEALRAIPCLTIHRLLGTLPHRSSFRKDRKHPLRYDTLVVDESSMIDLPLMLRLFEALPDSCRILLLGDKDQLASVDVGSVLSDILEASASEESALAASVEHLTKTYRFAEDSGIYRACQLARNGDEEAFAEMLHAASEDFEFHPMKPDAKRIPDKAIARTLQRYWKLVEAADPESALRLLNDGITLTATRQGAFGCVEYNRLVEMNIRRKTGLDALSTDPLHATPIIVLENDYELELYNGDLGLVWIDAESGLAYGCFTGSGGELRRLRMNELPRHESAFALTIHKSQGSEFTETMCLFAPKTDRNLSRELVYTAFSRAKQRLLVFAESSSLGLAIGRKADRATRLQELLRASPDNS